MGTARFETMLDYGRRGVDVAVRCDACRHVRNLTAAQIEAIFGAARVVEAQRRLRCSQCGHRGARLAPIPPLSR